MVTKDIQGAINAQINREFFAAYLYLGMMTYFESRSLPGFGHWMRLQAREEVAHAMKLVDFLLDRGADVELHAIDRPGREFESPLAVMRAALEHERKVTASIHALYAMAVEQNDYPAQVLMQWFVSEQVEEREVLSLVDCCPDDGRPVCGVVARLYLLCVYWSGEGEECCECRTCRQRSSYNPPFHNYCVVVTNI